MFNDFTLGNYSGGILNFTDKPLLSTSSLHTYQPPEMPVGDKLSRFQERARRPIEPFRNDQFYKMTQTLYLNVLDPQ